MHRSWIALISLAALLLVAGCKKTSTPVNKAKTPAKRVKAPSSRAAKTAKKAKKPAKKKPSYDLSTTQWSLEKKFKVSYTTKPAKMPLNDYFDITFVIKDAKGNPAKNIKFKADADMPEHRHGMKVYPKQKKLKDGVFEIKGFLFHMPGHWVIEADVIEGGKKYRASFHVVL